jgi:hypothetical protein
MNITFKSKSGKIPIGIKEINELNNPWTTYKSKPKSWTTKPKTKLKSTNFTEEKKLVSIGTQTDIKNKTNSIDEECCICFESHWVCKSKCQHYICLNCLIQIKKECPICRVDMSDSIPNALKPIVKMNKRINIKQNLNIYDNSEFPNLF